MTVADAWSGIKTHFQLRDMMSKGRISSVMKKRKDMVVHTQAHLRVDVYQKLQGKLQTFLPNCTRKFDMNLLDDCVCEAATMSVHVSTQQRVWTIRSQVRTNICSTNVHYTHSKNTAHILVQPRPTSLCFSTIRAAHSTQELCLCETPFILPPQHVCVCVCVCAWACVWLNIQKALFVYPHHKLALYFLYSSLSHHVFQDFLFLCNL